jgi:tetratricopeptide (TPR) repeat protein
VSQPDTSPDSTTAAPRCLPLPTLARLSIAATFVLLLIFGVRQIGSHDLGFHLRAGESIVQGQGWPTTDPFTFTVSDHPYVDTSWGFQVLVHLVETLLGATGLVAWQIIVALACFLLVYRTTRLNPVDPLVLVAVFLVAVVAVEIRLDVRPEWLSYLLLAATLHILSRHEQGLKSPLWLLPLIQLVWVNVHSLFVLGWAAMACFVAGSLVRAARSSPVGRGIDRRLLGYCAAALPVTLLNPYGYKALLFPILLITRLNQKNVFGASIGELFSIFAVGDLPNYPWLSLSAVRVLMVLVALSAVLLLRQRGLERLSRVLLVLVFMPLAIQAVRNVPLLLVACVPGLAAAVQPGVLDRWVPAHRRRWLRDGLLLLLLIVTALLGARVVNDGYYIADRRQVRFGSGWNSRMLPVQATEWLSGADLDGRMLNDLGFGGYLMWRLRRPVFIDGRLEVMGEEFFNVYRAALKSPATLNAAASRYGIRWLILPYRAHSGLVYALTREPGWSLLYVDGLAAIYARVPTGLSSVDLSARRIAAGPHGGMPLSELPGLGGGDRRSGVGAWLRGVLATQEFPTEDYGLGQFHYFRAEMPSAFAHFSQAIYDSGGAYLELYNNLGAAALFQGRRDEARRAFEVVLSVDPSNPYAKKKLAELASADATSPPRP